MKSKSLGLLFVLGLGLSGCSLFETQVSHVNEEDDYAAYAAQKNGMSETFDELGYQPSRSLSDDEKEALFRRMKLKRLEKGLTDKEREQYFGYKTYIDNDEDRITFLSLPDMQARDRYAMQRGFYTKTNRYPAAIKDAVNRGDIVVGMTKEAVQESWGEPEDIEVAGNRMYGNEKWKYLEYNSTPDGFQKEERVIIFEGGKVAGWKRYQ